MKIEGWGNNGMGGGCFTDVVLHSSKNYHREQATEPRRLSKDVMAAWGRCNFTFPWSGQSAQVVSNLCPWSFDRPVRSGES